MMANARLNEHGVEDIAGNVWEWTSTCFMRSRIDEAGNAGRPTVNCGVRIAEGAHRAHVTDFIRDSRAGGCAQGVPPANLGLCLVRADVLGHERVVAMGQGMGCEVIILYCG